MKPTKYVRLAAATLFVMASVVSASAQGTKPTPENKDSKTKAAELEKEQARVAEENRKIAAANEAVARTFKTGNDALSAGRYDAAIAAYDEGIAVREDPALLTNRAEALCRRGVERFNAAVKSAAAVEQASREAAFKDWADAAESARKALHLINTMAASAVSEDVVLINKLAALSIRAEAMRLVASKVDNKQVDAAVTAYQQYIAATVDPAQKSKLQKDMAKMMLDAAAYERAIVEYRKIIAADPNDAASYFHLGVALFGTADKARLQEAANYLAAFVEKATDADPSKAQAKTILQFLKEQENITPMPIRRGSG